MFEYEFIISVHLSLSLVKNYIVKADSDQILSLEATPATVFPTRWGDHFQCLFSVSV